uniref:MFS domain-containing protein n=1 Tax=Mesocestoides corti TaxID=53468 RepID=A0A5K3EU77_MESCO
MGIPNGFWCSTYSHFVCIQLHYRQHELIFSFLHEYYSWRNGLVSCSVSFWPGSCNADWWFVGIKDWISSSCSDRLNYLQLQFYFYFSAGVALSALTVSHGIGPFIVTYTVMFGLGMGLPYTVLFTLAGAWFPKHRAFVIGIILIGQGIGTLLFTLTQTALIDQRDLPTNNSLVLKKLPQSFLILASIMFAFQFIGFFLCRAYQPGTDSKGCTRKASYELEFDDDVTHQSSTSEFESGPSQISEIYNYTISEALRSIDFYLLAFTIFINTISVTLQSSLYKVRLGLWRIWGSESFRQWISLKGGLLYNLV